MAVEINLSINLLSITLCRQQHQCLVSLRNCLIPSISGLACASSACACTCYRQVSQWLLWLSSHSTGTATTPQQQLKACEHAHHRHLVASEVLRLAVLSVCAYFSCKYIFLLLTARQYYCDTQSSRATRVTHRATSTRLKLS